jgi:hypothetical protein
MHKHQRRWPLGKVFHLLAEHGHLGHQPLAQEGAHDPEVLYDEFAPRRHPLELFAAADARKFVLIAAQQENPLSSGCPHGRDDSRAAPVSAVLRSGRFRLS